MNPIRVSIQPWTCAAHGWARVAMALCVTAAMVVVPLAAAKAQQPGATPPPPRQPHADAPPGATSPPPRQPPAEATSGETPARPAVTPPARRTAPQPRPRRQQRDMERRGAEPTESAVSAPSSGPGAPPSKRPPDASPVVRAKAGNWGMFFRFGGLADLHHSGNTRSVSGLLITQVGFKAVVSESFIIPIYFGTGYRLVDPDSQLDDQKHGDFGFEVGVSFEWHFRVWRRISPFVALNVGLGMTNPSGEDNWTFGFGVGPAMGVEYYIGDRVSLTALYLLNLQFEIDKWGDTNAKTFQLNTVSGGALNVSYYF